MKRKSRVLMLCLAAAVSFAAFGSVAFAKERIKLTVWTEKSFAEQADRAFVYIVNRFAKQNNIEVEILTISWGEYVKKLIAAIEAKAAPDLSMLDNGATMQYAASNQLVDVSSIFRQVVKKEGEPLEVAYNDATVNGKQYSIPLSVMTHALNVRKDLLDAKGIAIPQTWDEVLSASRMVANPPSIYGYALPLGKTKDAENFITQILWAFGSRMVAKDGKTITFDSPETVAAVKFIAELYKYMPPGAIGWDDSGDNRAFQAEQLAFATNSGTIYKWAVDNKPDLANRMAIALTPAGPAGRHNIASGRSLAIFKTSKNQAMAKKLLAYIMEPSNYHGWLEGYGGYYAPAYKGTMELPFWQDPVRKTFMENATYGHAIGWPGPITLPVREIYNNFLYTEMVQMVLVQGKTPEQAVKETTKKIKDIYSRY